MDATRARASSLLEWLAALACMIAITAIGSVLVRDFRSVSALDARDRARRGDS
jgi:hypothetical protein